MSNKEFTTPEESQTDEIKTDEMMEKAPWRRFTEEEWKELVDGKNKILKMRRKLFTSVMDVPEVDWIVDGFVVRDGITLLFGDAGIGKTSLMLQLIGCLSEGKGFLGLSTQQADALLIEQDEGKPLLRSHIEKMLPAHPSLRWLEVPTVSIIWDNNAQDFEAKGTLLAEVIHSSLARVVIIDSLTSLGITDINHPSVSLLFDKIRELAGIFHCAFVLLHHPNKSGDAMGSNLIKAKVDCLIQMESAGEAVKLIPHKVRGESFQEMILHLDPKTLTFQQVPLRDDWIWQLHQEGKKPKEIADIICPVYPGTTSNNVSVILNRLKGKHSSN
jgi:predicted ATP-dependent serine protease